jgi:hypothetical protein
MSVDETPKGQDAPELIEVSFDGYRDPEVTGQSSLGFYGVAKYTRADLLTAAQARAEQAEAEVARLRGAVDAAVNIGLVLGAIGEDAVMIEAFRNECGPDLIARARAALSEGGE